ncbi:molybdate ABC transporter permease subunit [Methanococcoides sp. FTZ1]|uniref:molybdate ABC transporter permease subunit n=1 Tax=Methanococcoides sp. FTZ1 TaxID=3439061 RepID=UPI003F84C9F5
MLESVWFPLILTLRVSIVSTLFVLLMGILIAYVFARKDFAGKRFAEAMVTMPLVLPPTVTGYLLVILLAKNGIIGSYISGITSEGILFTWQAAVIAAFVVSLPLMVKTATAAIETVDRELEYAAYTLGRSELETVLFITLPLAKKGILAGCVLSFARAVGEFGATLMVAGNVPGKTNTMSLSIYGAFQTGNNELANLLVIILIIVSLLSIGITSSLVDKWKV